MDKKAIIEIEKIINYTFKQNKYLERAFLHASFANQSNLRSYDRLEFLGDSILGFVITDKICTQFPDADQGDLTALKKTLVSTNPLSMIMRKLGLDKYIVVSKATLITDNICEDVFEALVAAIYLDSQSIETAKNFILSQYTDDMFNLERKFADYKSKILEEYGVSRVKFKTIQKTGKEHNPIFTIALYFDGVEVVRTNASKKIIGEQICSKMFYDLKK